MLTHRFSKARTWLTAAERPSRNRSCDWHEPQVRTCPLSKIRLYSLMLAGSGRRRGIDCETSLDLNAISHYGHEPTTNGVSTDMSKSNVNPNHYKVAGRERQGEDIAQARNKQKHAENVARRRTEIGPRSRKPAAQLGAASPDAAPTPARKTATGKARATPLQAPSGRKRGHNLVPGGSGPHARALRAPRVPVPRPAGATPQLPPKQAAKTASVKAQGSDQRSKRSAAQKRAASRGDVGALPVTGAVVGVFGKRLPRRRPEPRT